MKYRTGKTIENAELRSIQLEILQSVHHFCELNGLKYSLAYGTLLGAVRHKGYIPWDDDIDIMMPRTDYEVFMEKFDGAYQNLSTINYKKSKFYPFSFGKVVDNRTVLVESLTKISVYIDVFPIDGLPSKELYNEYLKRLKFLQHNISITCFINKEQRPWFTRFKRRIKIFFFLPSRNKCIANYEKYVKQNTLQTSQWTHVTGWDTMFPSFIFEKYIKLQFEGQMYYSISEYDYFLTQRYGNYMEIPPESERITHSFYAYWK